MPDQEPPRNIGAPSRPRTLPWAEVASLLTGTARVLGTDEVLPPGWSAADPIARHSAVVVVDPVDCAALQDAHDVAGDRPLVVVTSNLSRPALVRALLVGRGDDVLPGRTGLPRDRLDRTMAALARTPRAAGIGERPAATGRPLDDLLAQVAASAGGHDRPWLVTAYDVGPGTRRETPESGRPFLSVLVRTQGRRADALADVLLCLGAQTDQDIEVLVLAHDVTGASRDRLDAQVAALPDGLRARTVVEAVEGGGRSRPLTVGTGRARGRYLAILDDDDLVLGHWVETFHAAADAAPGSIVRSLAVEQDAEQVAGAPGFRATSWPVARWDARFSLLSHVVDNHSPVHSYAYPREVFAELGLGFDESLPVLEDWDLLVRAAALVGVHDTGDVTAIYRRWPAAASSFAEVAEASWPDTAWRVVAGWDSAPLLLPAGSATRLRREGIETLRRRPLRQRVDHRIHRWRDRWSPGLMRTPAGPALRWVYRRAAGRTGPNP